MPSRRLDDRAAWNLTSRGGLCSIVRQAQSCLTYRTYLAIVCNGILTLFLTSASLRSEEKPPTAQPTNAGEKPVDFARQIKPIFEKRCVSCHARGQEKGGLSINSRESLLKGGESGPSVVPGKSEESLLYRLVSGAEPDRIMPEKGEKLRPEEIALVRRWIDEGAAWETGFRWKSTRDVAVVPRRPTVPAAEAGANLSNPIDLILQSHYKEQRIDPQQVVDDRLFARRVHLDLIGLLPTPDELDRFVADVHPHKRATLVRRLLARNEDYAVHWMSFWNDLLRNEYRGTGFIDDGRRQITGWLFAALYDNKPFDKFLHELISPVEGSEGFVKGIQWRGVVNASQRREVQAAQTLSQVFLGANLKCASCHDSFIDDWKLTDAWGLASVFADESLEIHRCDKETGEKAAAGFLFPQLVETAKLTPVNPQAARDVRMRQLADLMTCPQNGRVSRTIVNRLWARLLGRGIVEPLDRMDSDPWNADLLDWLASDLVDHHYDLKRTLYIICTSRAYQLPATGEARPGEAAGRFRGPLVKRMTAEQFIDALSSVTGIWQEQSGAIQKLDGRGQGGQVAAVERVLARRAAGITDEVADRSSDQAAPRRAVVAVKPYMLKRIRAALAMSDPLSAALDRPNREQVVTRRDSLATMLESLEMTNGSTLDNMLKRGSATWRNRQGKNSARLVHDIYRAALGRGASAAEKETALAVVGSPVTEEGIADLLWSLVMLPEFQLIY